ncbi:MAG: tRNA threonylcarbamoyladenosine dehydratase [Oscillibacter sp.]|nr:tRNA threonylcarbamoyladenosine dehydratase [Oscillibacter sp.]
MEDAFSRTRLLLGGDGMDRLARARVAVFGLGGVGGHACEALARSGVGAFDLIDHDTVSLSNLNRQIIAARSTLGRYKADVMRERILDINPSADVRIYKTFFLPESADAFPFQEYSYILDAVDTVTAKLALAEAAVRYGVPIISAMGAGNKLDPGRLRVADIYETRVCPLARIMRKELRRRGIPSLKVVYSEEPPRRPIREEDTGKAAPETGKAVPMNPDRPALVESTDTAPEVSPPAHGMGTPARPKEIPGSTAFVPSVAGLLMAGEVVRDLAGIQL